ncbi:MAG: winged helix-turn-helix transcriptional regulator [Thermoplasmata archaeon]
MPLPSFAAAIISEPCKIALINLLIPILLPLYARLRKENVLNNFTRGRTYQCILENPGIDFNTIKNKIGLRNGTLVYHLDLMEREKYIISRHDGRHKYYHIHPEHLNVPFSKVKDALDSAVPEIERKIIAVIEQMPGISQKEISIKIGANKRVVNYHINILKASDVIIIEKRLGRSKIYLSKKYGQAPREL